MNRLRKLPLFIDLLKLQGLRRFFRLLRFSILREVPLLYISVFIFNFAIQFFATSYSPSLKQKHVFDNQIFLITLSNTVVQAMLLYIINRKNFFKNYSYIGTIRYILVTRIAAFLFAGTASAILESTPLFYASLINFSILGVCWVLYNIPISSMIFRSLNPGKRGELLGIYTAFTGAFSFAGAFFSGYITHSLNFTTTSLISATLIFISLILANISTEIGKK